MDTKFLRGALVAAIGNDGEPAERGIVLYAGGPWKVQVQWDDGGISTMDVEDLIFE